MTKETLLERINSLKAKIAHSEEIIEKKEILIAKKQILADNAVDSKEEYWLLYDISSLHEDIKIHNNKIFEWNRQLIKYEEELKAIESVKRDIPVLVEFLNNWKKQVTDYYLKERDSEERMSFRKEISVAYDEYVEYRNSTSYNNLDQDKLTLLRAKYKELDRAYLAKYAFVLNLEDKAQYHGTTFEEELEKDLQRDWEVKYDDLVRRMTDVVGNIIDASFLSVSPKGNIDGYVVGDKGKAKVETVPAGGYNIQVFHYRVLVHKIN